MGDFVRETDFEHRADYYPLPAQSGHAGFGLNGSRRQREPFVRSLPPEAALFLLEFLDDAGSAVLLCIGLGRLVVAG